MTADSCYRVCCRATYSCNRRRPSETKKRHAGLWFSVATLVSLLTICWMYMYLVIYNDRDDINLECFRRLQTWINWSMVLMITSAVLTSYCILLLMFSLFQVALGEPLDLHWLHKVLLFLITFFIILLVIGISLQGSEEWPTVSLSLQATAPFLQIGGVLALTLLSWFIFQGFHKARRMGSKVMIMLLFAVVSAALLLSPLWIHSPCIIEWNQLPPKPRLIGHRGAPMLAPENTMMSFNRSVMCNVTAFETDVQLSKDRVPFLMHDNKECLQRTTDGKTKFPNIKDSGEITWAQLQMLNAGEWFIKTDPFRSVSQLSEEEKDKARTQTVPSLKQLLDLAKEHSISLIFDLKNNMTNNDIEDTVNVIQTSGINPSLILWLPPKNRTFVMSTNPGFVQVYNSVSIMEENKGNHLNMKYNTFTTTEIRELRQQNVSVNLWVVNDSWLFSLLWCAGTSSVTTNSCHLLKDMTRPDWILVPAVYKSIWIIIDLVSLLVMFGVFAVQRKRHCFQPRKGVIPHNHRAEINGNKTAPLLGMELTSPLAY